MQLDEQRLRFRDAMASLSAAVNVVTTAGEAGRCGITATAVCSVTDTPPSVMVCTCLSSPSRLACDPFCAGCPSAPCCQPLRAKRYSIVTPVIPAK